MRKILARAAAATLAVSASCQLIRPGRTNPLTDPSHTLPAQIRVLPEVQAVLQRACGDCHSNDTRWPWYSNVAPVSWFLIDHVNSGRRHFNYSAWPPRREDEARMVLKNTCDLVKKGDMPMPSYLWMHEDARLSEQDIAVLCAWSQEALRALPPGR